MALKLIIGNKNYSSWSFRPWIAMKVAGIAFEEEVISLEAPDFKARVSKVSAGRSRRSPTNVPMPISGPPFRRRARWPARLRPKCTRDLVHCAAIYP
jgi:hypothetical protein